VKPIKKKKEVTIKKTDALESHRHHEHHEHYEQVSNREVINAIHKTEVRIMAAIDNLGTAVLALEAQVALVVTALQSGSGLNDAAIQANTDRINAAIATLQAAVPAV